MSTRPKAGPPAPGRKTPGPFPSADVTVRGNPDDPYGFAFGPARPANGYRPVPKRQVPSPLVFGTVAQQPLIPSRVSGRTKVNNDLIKFLENGNKKSKPLAPTTDKPTPAKTPRSTIPPVVSDPTGSVAPPSVTLPALPSTATYQPVAPPPLYQPVATPQLDPYGGRTAASVANSQLAPQYKEDASTFAAQQAALKGFTASLLAQLKGLPAATADEYTQAENVTNALASKAADLLSGANPNAADQAILQSINAPESQQAALASKLANAFGGGAGVLYNNQGADTGSTLAAQKAAALSFANALPGINSLSALNAERNLLYQDAQRKAAIAAQFPTIENQVAAAKANARYNEAQFTASQRSAANTSAANRANFESGQHQTVASNALARAGYAQNNAALGIKTDQTLAKYAPTPSATWSRALGYKSDQYGNPILVNGKPQFLPGYSIDRSGNVVKKGSSSAAKPLTQTQINRLYDGVRAMQKGTAATKTAKALPPIGYEQAMQELAKEGYFRDPAVAAQALQALNTIYGKPLVTRFGSITVPGNEDLGTQGSRLGINPGSAS